MKKIETITSVIEAFDENERLKAEIKELKREQPNVKIEAVEMNDIQRNIYILGRGALFNKCTYSYREVNASYDDEDNIRVTKYDKWLDDKLQLNQLPPTISKNDFVEEFEKDLKEKYNEEKEEAIRNLKNE